MKLSKGIKPLIPAAVAAVIVGYIVRKGKIPIKSTSDIVQVVSDATSNAEKTFGGLTLSKLNEIALNTYKGVKAEIDGDTLEYTFASASGKKKSTARFILDSAGKLVITFLAYNDAKSPRFFMDNLKDAINEKQ